MGDVANIEILLYQSFGQLPAEGWVNQPFYVDTSYPLVN